MPTNDYIRSILNDLHAYAAQPGDNSKLQDRLHELESILSNQKDLANNNIEVGSISGSTAVAIGSDIRIFVNQIPLPNDLLLRMMALVDALEKRAIEAFSPIRQHLRVFLASPNDVKNERILALKVIDKLRTDPIYQNWTLEPVFGDPHEDSDPLLVSKSQQDMLVEDITRPSDCDIFVSMFWSNMGAPIETPNNTKPDGRPYRSVIEWELYEALQAFNFAGRPRLLIYRRTDEILLKPNEKDFDEKLKQWRLVQEFFSELVDSKDSFLFEFNTYQIPSQFADLLEYHLRKLLAQMVGERNYVQKIVQNFPLLNSGPIWPKGISPFPGLRAFGPPDAPVFFGRGTETDQLIKRLSDQACRFLVVVGASGSGKSSLVGAGLIPRLREGALTDSEHWLIVTFTPDGWGNGDPFDAVINGLVNLLGYSPRELRTRLSSSPAGFRNLLENYLAHDPECRQALIVVDQFEEIFTRIMDVVTRDAFFAALEEAAHSPRIRIVATLRDDFYPNCVKSPVLSLLINDNGGPFNLGAPAPLELHQMITGPARVAGIQIDAKLVGELLTSTNFGTDPGALALLAYALDQLYKSSVRNGYLTMEDYEAFGGVQGVIGTRAKETFDGLPPNAQAALPRVFRELVNVDENGAATRKRAPFKRVQIDSACAQLTEAFISARLLVASRSGDSNALVEVAHEALFRNWPRLKEWIDASHDALVLLRQVRAAAASWVAHNRQESYLWPDERLRLVYEMQELLAPEWTETEQEFIRPEVERLLEEVNLLSTTDNRRLYIGERIDGLGDCRSGIGLVCKTLPLYSNKESETYKYEDLSLSEVRFWGDQSEHINLPDIVWVQVDGGTIEIEDQLFEIGSFYISKYAITYGQFQSFIDDPNGFKNSEWWNGLAATDDHKRTAGSQCFKINNHPRDNVSWYDAIAFCRWLNSRIGWPELPINFTISNIYDFQGIRLPTEWEWQCAATNGRSDFEYPWGLEWDKSRANTSECDLYHSTAVGLYPAGASPTGAMDMSGNIWEWCLNEYKYLTNVSLAGKADRVVRGGAWFFDQSFARAKYRYPKRSRPTDRDDDNGFRIIVYRSRS